MRSTKSKKPNIRYGKVEISEEEFEPRNIKFRVTMFVDLDVLDEIRKRAAAKGLPYQTYINQLLRKSVMGDEDEARIRQIVRDEMAKRTA